MSALGRSGHLPKQSNERCCFEMRAALAIVLMLFSANSTARAPVDVMDVFRLLNINHDDNVSLDEWTRSVDATASRLPAGPGAEDYRSKLISVFHQRDTNGDGQVSPTEWKARAKAVPPPL